MKTILHKVIFVSLLSSTYCTGQKIIDAEKNNITPNDKMYYWENNSENQFHALTFDSAGCNLFSFGPGQPNTKRNLQLTYRDTIFEIEEPTTGKVEGYLQIFGDSVVSLKLTALKNATFLMVSNRKFEKMFNRLKSVYSVECIQSSIISFNGITPEQTSAATYLKNPSYVHRVETFEDEIYGVETLHYLDSYANRFYYTPTGKLLFTKIEIVSDRIEESFLNIRIGDSKRSVEMKLSSNFVPYRSTKSEVRVQVCNSRFVGEFGSIFFEFQRLGDNDQSLKKITYKPLEEAD